MLSSAKSFAVLAFLPIMVLDALLAPFWFVPGYPADHAWVPLSQVLISGFVFPLYLAVLGCVCVWRSHWRFAASMLGLFAVAGLLGVFLYHAVWGISTGLFWHPDIDSVALMEFLALWALLITLLPASLVFAFRLLVRRARSSPATAKA